MHYGLIGCGGIGQLRAAALAQLDSHELAGVADLDQGRARALAGQYNARAVPEWRALLEDDGIEAVIVSTPPSSHAEIGIAALQAGKHVLCEKPLARSVVECTEMMQAAEQSGKYLATGFNYRFYPSMRKAREMLDAGLIGELNHVRSYTGYSAQDHDQAWLHDAAVMGGGALRDNGIHLIDLTAYFLGDVAEVKGFGTNAVWKFPGCEDNGFALLRSSQGKIATLQASWTEWRGYQLLVELYGTRGCIRAWCFPMMVHATWTEQRGGKKQSKRHLFPTVQIMEKLRSYRWVVVQSFIEEFAAFDRAARGQTSDVASGADGLAAVRVAEEATAASLGSLITR